MKELRYFNCTRMKLLCFFILLFFGKDGFAQNRFISRANEFHERQEYYYAIIDYERALAKTKDSINLGRNISDCYDKLEETEKALEWYAFMNSTNSIDEESLKRYMLLLREVQEYEKSVEIAGKVIETSGPNDIAQGIIDNENKTDKLLNVSRLFGNAVESIVSEYSDISSGMIGDKQMLVSSTTPIQQWRTEVYRRTGSSFYNLFVGDIADNNEVVNLKPLNLDVETENHTGTATYVESTGNIYFTRNTTEPENSGGKNINHLDLFRGVFGEEGIEDVVKLDINLKGYSTGHPAVDEKSKTMYFVSNRPGGLGGTDIYKADIKEDGSLGAPINLGPEINSSGDEMFPYWDREEELLYFSSDGHNGLGGLDVFVVFSPETDGANRVYNLGSPVNSEKDDFGVNINKDMIYFTSGRDKSFRSDNVYWCEKLLPTRNSLILKGRLLNESSQESTKQVELGLYNEKGELLDKTKTDDEGQYVFNVNPDNNYYVSLLNSNLDDRHVVSTKDVGLGGSLSKDIVMDNKVDASVIANIGDESNIDFSDAEVIVTDNESGETSIIRPSAQGDLKIEFEGLKESDPINATVSIKKDGYLARIIDLSDLKAVEGQILLTPEKEESFKLKPLVLGDDLTNIYELNPIYFDLNSSILTKTSKKELDNIVKIMNDNRELVVELTSHTDCRNSDKYNLWLSERRAKSSLRYIKKRITNSDRISGKGYGESRLINECGCKDGSNSDCTEEEHKKNRRTEFIIVNEGK